MKVLVAGVGNILRGDDGFGVAVAQRLQDDGNLPAGVDVIETGTGGLAIVQQLMDGYQGLIVVDAVDLGRSPGSVFVIEPAVADPAALSVDQWRSDFSNLHLAEPSRVFVFARAAGVLPARVLLVGCQPESCEDYREGLTPAVESAVPVAAQRVRHLAAEFLNTAAVPASVE